MIGLLQIVACACLLAQEEEGNAHTEDRGWPQGIWAHQEDHKGLVFVGGALSLWHDNVAGTTKFEFHPEGGYLLNNQWGLGVMLGIGFEQERHGTHTHTHQEYKVAPFARWYFFRPNPFNLYLDMGAGWNLLRSKESDGRYSNKHGFELGIRPGACVDLIEGLCLCLRLGFIGYRKHFFTAEEQGISKDGFGILFSPEQLMIGLEAEF